MCRVFLRSALTALVLAIPSAACAARPAPVACCPVETTFVFREAEYPGSSKWDTAMFKCRLRSVLVSEDGRFRAGTYTVLDQESGSMVLLCDGSRTLGLQPFALATAWEPGGSRLLCNESAADDDLRMFVLDVGGGQYSMRGSDRLSMILGGRSDRFLRWEGDSILVHDYFDPLDRNRWIRLPDRGPAR